MTPKIDEYQFRCSKWESKQVRCLEVLSACADVELAYLAGLIDGEGTIGFRKMQGGYFRPILQIVNTNHLLIDYLRRYFWQAVVKCKNNRQVPYLRVTLGGFGISPFLEALTPYLIGKKLNAQLVCKYIKMRKRQPWRCAPSPQMLAILKDVRVLNSFGPESQALKKRVRQKHSSI